MTHLVDHQLRADAVRIPVNRREAILLALIHGRRHDHGGRTLKLVVVPHIVASTTECVRVVLVSHDHSPYIDAPFDLVVAILLNRKCPTSGVHLEPPGGRQ